MTDNLNEKDARSNQQFRAAENVRFIHRLPIENVFSVLKRLSDLVPSGPGVIVCNDLLELAMLGAFPKEQMVVHINHGDFDYYYDLAKRHSPEIDCFVAYSEHVYQRLCEELPDRKQAVFHIPYGVNIPDRVRKPASGPLRLLFVGRIIAEKGVFDLPKIDKCLKEWGLDVTWTLQGTGLALEDLRKNWPGSDHYQWNGFRPVSEVLKIYPEHDVLVMPSTAEGFPSTLLEAAAAGVVPVVTDLQSGIPEIVRDRQTGFRRRLGDTEAFAAAIREFYVDRDLLESCSRNIRALVGARFDIEQQALRYEEFYGRWRELRSPQPKQARRVYGSRLDQRWIPNSVVFPLRWLRKRITGSTLGKRRP